MILYSTQQKSSDVSFEEAIFRGLPPDNGLYMPTEIQPMPAAFFDQIHTMTLPEIAEAVCQNLLGHDLSPTEIKSIITSSMTFEAPLFDLEPAYRCWNYFTALRWPLRILVHDLWRR